MKRIAQLQSLFDAFAQLRFERLPQRFAPEAAGRAQKQQLLTQGAEAAPSTPEQLGEFVKSELQRWVPIIKAAGIKAG